MRASVAPNVSSGLIAFAELCRLAIQLGCDRLIGVGARAARCEFTADRRFYMSSSAGGSVVSVPAQDTKSQTAHTDSFPRSSLLRMYSQPSPTLRS